MAAHGEEQGAAAGRETPGHDTLAAAIGCAALFLLALSPWLVDRSGPEPFYKGPLIFPMMVLATIIAGAMPSIWRMVLQPAVRPLHVDGHGFPARGSLLFAMISFYPSAIAAVGLEAATSTAILLGLLINRLRLLPSLAITATFTALAWLAFKAFLDIWFPQPWLFSMFGT